VVEDNTVYDNMATNIFCNTCGDLLVQRNLVYSSSTHSPPNKGISIGLDWDIPGDTAYSSNHTVINNMVIGCQFNFSFNVYTAKGNWPGRGALINTLIAHNTFVNANANGTARLSGASAPAAIWIAPHSEHKNVRIENNIFLQDLSKGRLVSVPQDPAFHWSHNLWSSPPPSDVQSPRDVIGDPVLKNPNAAILPGEVKPDWYKLDASSPAIDAAKSISEASEDFFRSSRNRSPDTGADEYEP